MSSHWLALIAATLLVLFCIVNVAHAKILFTGRKYYIGGDFTRAVNDDKTELKSPNLVVYNGEKWELPGGLSPNGPVRTVFRDLCQNLWIGGEFDKVGDTKTGPLAVMYRGSNTFEPVGKGASSDGWSSKAVVRDLHVDCANLPSGGVCTKQQCDIYVAGEFSKAGTGVESNLVAYWKAKEDKWHALPGLKGEKANAVRYFSNIKTVFVGGDIEGYILKAKRDESPTKWEKLADEDNVSGGVVRTLYSDPGIPPFNNNHLYIGGEFDKPFKRIVRYSTNSGTFSPLAESDNDKMTGSVRAIGLSSDHVYIAGDFETQTTKFVAKAKPDDKYWTLPSGAPVKATSRVNAMFVCSKTHANCKDGDAFVAGKNPNKDYSDYNKERYWGNAYFENDGGDWTQFGFGVDGEIYSINTAFSGASRSISIATHSATLAVTLMVAMLAILSFVF